MNAIWFGLLFTAFVAAAFGGRMDEITRASFDSAKASVELAIGLVGTMTLWLGLMRVARDGGLARAMARLLRPVMVRLFPDVPAEHPAMSAMIMNFVANMLGLANAATPMGIKAMMELDTLNPKKGTATNAMVLFLAINTSALALLPTGVMAIRASLGSSNPGAIVLATWFATACSTVVALVTAKLFCRMAVFGPDPGVLSPDDMARADVAADLATLDGQSTPPEVAESPSILWGLTTRRRAVTLVLATAVIGSCVLWGVQEVSGLVVDCRAGSEPFGRCLGLGLLRSAGLLTIPLLMIVLLLYGLAHGVRVYNSFIDGAKEGFDVALKIIPYLVAILVAVAMLRASGALDAFIALLRPLVEPLGMPAEVLPMALIRPLSGSGAMGVMTETMQAHGPDSMIGMMVSTLNGSMETTFYVVAVYFGAVRVNRIRHTIAAGLLADLTGVVATIFICRMMFG
ncbi:MAG: nucleoside recognition domain-containing protein [Pseudomonadota bacterium]